MSPLGIFTYCQTVDNQTIIEATWCCLAKLAEKMKMVSTSGSIVSSPTKALATFVAEATPDGLSQAVRKEATRTFLNWLGCTIGGAQHKTVDIALAALSPFSGPAEASVLGRSE